MGGLPSAYPVEVSTCTGSALIASPLSAGCFTHFPPIAIVNSCSLIFPFNVFNASFKGRICDSTPIACGWPGIGSERAGIRGGQNPFGSGASPVG